jgi:hypothetical protein
VAGANAAQHKSNTSRIREGANTARRRGHGEAAVYFDAAKNRYVGAISVGFGPDGKRFRRKVTGRTKTEVRDKAQGRVQRARPGTPYIGHIHGPAEGE